MAMPTRHVSGRLYLAAVGVLCAGAAWAQTQAGAQASGQEAVTTDRSGTNVQGSTAGAAHADDASASLASGSSVNAVLTKPVDSGRSKPGDPVSARTTQNARTEGGTSIPKGSTLIGHVSDAHAAAESQTGSSMGIVFDKAVTRDGHEIPLRNVGIQAVAAAEASAASNAGDAGAMAGAAGGAGTSRGGGLLGRTTGTVGGTVGSGLGAAGGVGSLPGGSGALQAGPGAMGGLDTAGMLTAGSSGVFGLHGLSLSGGAADATTGSVMTSSGKSVHLAQGTRFLLSSPAATSRPGSAPRPSGAARPDSKQPSGDRR
jgi:ribonuclease E